MEVINDLPQEILYDIFSRIPAEVLITLKAVCKLWQTIIVDDQEFANAHLIRHRGEDSHYFIVQKMNKIYPFHPQYELISSLQYDSNSNKGAGFKLDFPQLVELMQNKSKRIFLSGFCNGLLLYLSIRKKRRHPHEKELWICNPVTRKCTTLPLLKTDHEVGIWNWALVHDASIHNYKVMGISSFTGEIFIFIPSNRNSDTVVAAHWKVLVIDYPGYSESRIVYRSTLIKNDLYWLSKLSYCGGLDAVVIMCSLDISKEEFRVTQIPFLMTARNQKNEIIEVMGSVCITDYCKNKLDIWTLQDKMDSLWTKTHTINLDQFQNNVYIAFRNYPSNSQARLVICNEGQIFICNLKNNDLSRIEFPEFPPEYKMDIYPDGPGHVNSLVSSQIMIGPQQKIQNEMRNCTSKKQVIFKSIWCTLITVFIGILIMFCFTHVM